ncbi:hypothetical protein FH972_021116 [Carpinus fangiana]|uniref:Uncharacterized protein n=1 Tax=Carpinus fangiana TaxID=176857 RepID=A0A5N6KQJ2_9ROSI|nr:hypothetical protein FH972_021116 [Carpinus fangiana]
MLRGQKVLHARRAGGRHALLLTHRGARARRALGDDGLVVGRGGIRVTDAEHVDAAQQRAVEVRLVGVHVAVEARVDAPLDEAQRGAKAGRQAVADGAVEVVAEEQVGAGDGLCVGGQLELEGNAVEVGGVGGFLEVVAGWWGGCGEATDSRVGRGVVGGSGGDFEVEAFGVGRHCCGAVENAKLRGGESGVNGTFARGEEEEGK